MKITSTKGLLVVVLALVIVAAGWTAFNGSSTTVSVADGASKCWACPSADVDNAGAGCQAGVAACDEECKESCDKCTGDCGTCEKKDGACDEGECAGNCDACDANPAGCPMASEVTCPADSTTCLASAASADTQKPAVNPEKCIGCGMCVRKAPDAFEMNAETGKAQVKPGAPVASIAKGAKTCPAKAIAQ